MPPKEKTLQQEAEAIAQQYQVEMQHYLNSIDFKSPIALYLLSYIIT